MTVFKRNDNWWIDYYYEGKRQRQKIGSRRKDAEEALSRIKVQIATGEYVPPELRQIEAPSGPHPILFEDFAKVEFLPWTQAQYSKSHQKNLEVILRVSLIPFFGQLHLHPRRQA